MVDLVVVVVVVVVVFFFSSSFLTANVGISFVAGLVCGDVTISNDSNLDSDSGRSMIVLAGREIGGCFCIISLSFLLFVSFVSFVSFCSVVLFALSVGSFSSPLTLSSSFFTSFPLIMIPPLEITARVQMQEFLN